MSSKQNRVRTNVEDPLESQGIKLRTYRRTLPRSVAALPIQPVPSDQVAYRAKCPHCHARIVVMSHLSPGHVSVAPPERGDGLRCDGCGGICLVTKVSGQSVTVVRMQGEWQA